MIYNIVRRDRPLNDRNGGGVCFYVRSNINYIVREDLVSDQLENLSMEIIKPRSKPFIVVTWYRPPNSPFELFSTFADFVRKLDADGKEYYIMGDFITVICFHRLFITLILKLPADLDHSCGS